MSIRNELLEEILLAINGGAPLSPEQEAAVQSIIDAPDDNIMLARSGVLAPSLFSQESDTQIKGEVDLELSNKNPIRFGEQFVIGEAGSTLLVRDKTTSSLNTFCGTPVDFSSSGEITGKPYSLSWGEYQMLSAQPDTDATRQGDYTFPAPVNEPDRVISKIFVKVQSQVSGVRVVLRELSPSGPVIFKSHSDAQWEAGEGIEFDINGDGVINLVDEANEFATGYPFAVSTQISLFATIEKFENPEELVLIGTVLNPLAPGVFLPYQIQEYYLETRSELVNSLIYTPIYKDANSTDLNINNLEAIAADTDSAGSLTLSVDVDNVDVFWVFDYAGRWNGNQRRVTVSLSNGDNYFLTRRNRKYFFYKDSSNTWQWYYQPNSLG